MRPYYTRPMSRVLDPNVSNVQVDALALAHGGSAWQGEFRTRRFPRLIGVAASDVPSVQVRLQFALLDGKPIIHGTMQGTMELICQRCMGRMQHEIDERFDLMLVESESQFDAVPESHEPWLTDSALTDVIELVEEQLLLALPLLAKHADESECVAVAAKPKPAKQQQRAPAATEPDSEAPSAQRPFANLRDLLRK